MTNEARERVVERFLGSKPLLEWEPEQLRPELDKELAGLGESPSDIEFLLMGAWGECLVPLPAANALDYADAFKKLEKIIAIFSALFPELGATGLKNRLIITGPNFLKNLVIYGGPRLRPGLVIVSSASELRMNLEKFNQAFGPAGLGVDAADVVLECCEELAKLRSIPERLTWLVSLCDHPELG